MNTSRTVSKPKKASTEKFPVEHPSTLVELSPLQTVWRARIWRRCQCSGAIALVATAAGSSEYCAAMARVYARHPTPRLDCCEKPAGIGEDHLREFSPAPVVCLGTVRILREHYPDGDLAWAVRLSTTSGRERVG